MIGSLSMVMNVVVDCQENVYLEDGGSSLYVEKRGRALAVKKKKQKKREEDEAP